MRFEYIKELDQVLPVIGELLPGEVPDPMPTDADYDEAARLTEAVRIADPRVALITDDHGNIAVRFSSDKAGVR